MTETKEFTAEELAGLMVDRPPGLKSWCQRSVASSKLTLIHCQQRYRAAAAAEKVHPGAVSWPVTSNGHGVLASTACVATRIGGR